MSTNPTKFTKLKEEVVIDINQNTNNQSDLIDIIFRNPNNEDLKYKLDNSKVISVEDLRHEVSIYIIKLIF